MLATINFETIAAILTAVVTAVIAILNALKKQKYAGLVNGLWKSIKAASQLTPTMPTYQNETDKDLAQLLKSGSDSDLQEFVHRVITLYQRTTPQRKEVVGGNTIWNEAIEKVLDR